MKQAAILSAIAFALTIGFTMAVLMVALRLGVVE